MCSAPYLDSKEQTTTIIAIVFAALGGYIESIGYTKLLNLFIGPMSGNTVVLATSAGAGDGALAATRGVTIAVFMGGVVLGTVVRHVMKRSEILYAGPALFLLEAAFLVVFYVLGQYVIPPESMSATGWAFYVLMPPAVLSMAIQAGG